MSTTPSRGRAAALSLAWAAVAAAVTVVHFRAVTRLMTTRMDPTRYAVLMGSIWVFFGVWGRLGLGLWPWGRRAIQRGFVWLAATGAGFLALAAIGAVVGRRVGGELGELIAQGPWYVLAAWGLLTAGWLSTAALLASSFGGRAPGPALEGFEAFAFEFAGRTKTVYRRGEGPAVVLIHELPGMYPECVDLARRIAAEGYCVYMPLLFGKPNSDYGFEPLLWPCVWREFSVLSTHGASPVADWLRALARRAREERGGRGVGAIGMCFTGRFALSLMMDDGLLAPVLSQPSSSYSASAMGLPRAEWDNAVRRSRDENVPVLGLRFEGDGLCRRERFETLKEGFGGRFREVVVAGSHHSVLTLNFKDLSGADRERVWTALTGFLNERLK
jgi:dienelactone hydrolase